MNGRIDDFKFKVYADHASVVKYNGKSKEVIIPEEYNGVPVTSIFDDCFEYSEITSVVGKSIEYIGEYALGFCKSLTIVDFPACMNIGDFAFRCCSSLAKINLPVCANIGNGAFDTCKSLTEVNLPACTNIGASAFNGCTSLAKINLPACTSVGGESFNNCTSLTEINLPVCKYIGEYAFDGCTSLIKRGKYKATKIDLTCRDFQYKIGQWFEEEEAVLCRKGFHYVENFFDLFTYYWGELGEDLRIFEIEAEEISDEHQYDSKRVCKKIKLVKEIKTYQKIFKI